MPQAYETDHAGIETALHAWAAAYLGIPAERVHWVPQEIGRPSWPFATLQATSPSIMDGIDAETRQHNADTERVDVVTHGPRRMSLQVTIYDKPPTAAGQDPAIKLAGLVASLRSPKVKDDLRAVGLGFYQQLSNPIRHDNQVGDRWEWVVSVDLEFGFTSVFTDDSTGDPEGGLNWIETADDPTINT